MFPNQSLEYAKRQGSVSVLDRESLAFRQVSRPEDLGKVFRLRYQVYVVERGFERPEDHPRGMERDLYEAAAMHFLCETAEGLPVATIRLILPSPLGFPVDRHCELSIDPAWVPQDRLGEISRLAVTRRYQRRREDPLNPSGPDGPREVAKMTAPDRRRDDPVRGLYRQVYQTSKRLGITHWWAAFERKLWIALRRNGWVFEQIGPYVDYHGLRAQFLCEVAASERFQRERMPDLYRYYSGGP